jgi:MFS superfamily sulfate permease-like transporter
VIKGMLTGIGIIIILKQLPHALGYDKDYEGDLSFQSGGENTLTTLANAVDYITPGALLISGFSLLLLVLWDTLLMKRHRIFEVIQAPVVVVLLGIVFYQLFQVRILPFSLNGDQVVNIPVAPTLTEFFGMFTFPDFSYLSNPQVYITAAVLALIASLETLLCVEATDKLDPYKRITPTNRELKAQGLGNLVSGLIGGLPITQVIVRSSTNIAFGGRTKMSAIFHGCFLLATVLFIPQVLNMIPLATLAAVLIIVGYKLAKPSLFKAMYKLGWNQFIPFIATVAGIVFTDLLTGIAIGMAVAIFYILRRHYKNPYVCELDKKGRTLKCKITLAEEVSFLNKGSILQTLNKLPFNASVVIDGSNSRVIDHDVIEVIRDFTVNAKNRNLEVEVVGLPLHQQVNRNNNYQKILEKDLEHYSKNHR